MNQSSVASTQNIKQRYVDISDLKPSSFIAKEQEIFGNKYHFHVYSNGKQIASFYFNLTGYNADFLLMNKEGTHYGFGKDRSLKQQMTTLKGALKEGFTFIKHTN